MDVSVTILNQSSAQSLSCMTGPVGGRTATWAGATTATTLGPSTWIWTWTPPSPLRAVNSQTFLNHPPPSTHHSPTKSWLPSDPWCKIASTNLSRQTQDRKQKRLRQVIEVQTSKTRFYILPAARFSQKNFKFNLLKNGTNLIFW